VNTGRQRPETEVTLKHKTELILYSYKNQQLQLSACQVQVLNMLNYIQISKQYAPNPVFLINRGVKPAAR